MGWGSSSSANGSRGSEYVAISSKGGGAFNQWSSGASDRQDVTFKMKDIAAQKFFMMRLVYANWHAHEETPYTNDIEVGASVEGTSLAGSTRTVVATFGGQRKVTIPSGAYAVSDPIAVGFEKDAAFYIKTHVRCVDDTGTTMTNGRFPVGVESEGSGSNEGILQGDGTSSGTFTATTTSDKLYQPIAILGIPDIDVSNRHVSVVFFGDSITNGVGSNDSNSNNWAGKSYAYLASRQWGRGIIRLASNGGEMPADELLMRYRAQIISEYATHVICAYGSNDMKNKTISDLATTKAKYTRLWKAFRGMGKKVYQITVGPRYEETGYVHGTTTTPESGFESGSDSLRGQINAWIRAGGDGLLDGYFDTADALETARDSNIFKAGYNNDYVHPKLAGYTAMANVVDLSTLT